MISFLSNVVSFLARIPTPVRYGLLGVALAIGGYFVGRYTTPAKLEIREVEKLVEVEKAVVVEKVVTVEKVRTVVAKHRVTNERVTEQPDGTKVTERTTTVTAGSTTDRTANSATDRGTEMHREVTRDTSKTRIESMPRDWIVSGLVGVQVTGNQVTPVYGAHVQRRVLGPVFAGLAGAVAQDGKSGIVTLSVGGEF